MENHSIGLLNDSFPPVIDGVANAVANYAANITAHHGSAVVVTPAYPDAHDEDFSFPIVRYPSIDTSKLIGYRAGYPFSPDVARQLQAQKVELLHSHCPVASTLLARQLRDLLDAPLVFTYHTKFDIDIRNAIQGKFLQDSLIRALVQNVAACDEVWTVSRGAGENLRSIGYEGDYTVIQNGVDMPRGRVSEEAIARVTAGYDLPSDVPMFLFVGRLMWYKGIRIILDALATLKRENRPFRMVFVGGGGDEAEVRDYAQKLGLGAVCFFTGALHDREQIRAWYCRGDLLLLPSTFDNSPLVVREAAACSLGAALIRGSSSAEGVTDGVNGLLIEENAPSLAACLRDLTIEKMHEIGEGASRDIYLSWKDAVDLICEQYEIVLDRHRSGVYRKRRKTVMDSYFKLQGELMDAFAKFRTFTENMQSSIENQWEL
ncbi:MAG: glycosyltransferase [Oscillospiraceae bacterium]|nr:glycosyltransferase [Oscillospiraceae bacterium]